MAETDPTDTGSEQRHEPDVRAPQWEKQWCVVDNEDWPCAVERERRRLTEPTDTGVVAVVNIGKDATPDDVARVRAALGTDAAELAEYSRLRIIETAARAHVGKFDGHDFDRDHEALRAALEQDRGG